MVRTNEIASTADRLRGDDTGNRFKDSEVAQLDRGACDVALLRVGKDDDRVVEEGPKRAVDRARRAVSKHLNGDDGADADDETDDGEKRAHFVGRKDSQRFFKVEHLRTQGLDRIHAGGAK